MKNEVFFIVMLCVSMAILIGSFAASICLSNSRKKRSRERGGLREYKFLLTSFQLFAVGFFIAAFCVFLPLWFSEDLSGETGFTRFFSTVFLTFHRVFRLFSLDEDFSGVQGLAFSSAFWGNLYYCYTSVLFVIGPILTMGFILSFFKEVTASFNYRILKTKRDIYVFSELNEKSLSLAQDVVLHSEKTKHKCVVVFADVYEKNEESNFELINKAKYIGAICTKRDITQIWLKFDRRITRKIYLIGENQDENVQQALALIETCREDERYNSDKTQIYLFSTTVESEALLNSVDCGKLKIRRVNENYNFAITTLRQYSIFEKAQETDNGKEINILIVGMGAYGTELLKTLCWMGQMPGYRLKVHVFDKEQNGERKFKSIAPELVKYNDSTENEEPYYKVVFHDSVNVNEYAFQEETSELDDVSMAFVTLGDDELNIETAMKLRVQFGRNSKIKGTAVPPILTVVYSHEKTEATKNGLKNMKEQDYGITFIGDISSVYSLANVEQEKLENMGMTCHMHWAEVSAESEKTEELKKQKLDKERGKFNRFEYFRRSSIAEAVYYEIRKSLGITASAFTEQTLQEFEHKRWMAYMRAEGYIGGVEGDRDDIAKTHCDLIHYSKLPDDEKKKDENN